MSSLKGNRAAQRKRRPTYDKQQLKEFAERKAHSRDKQNIEQYTKKISLSNLDDFLDDEG